MGEQTSRNGDAETADPSTDVAPGDPVSTEGGVTDSTPDEAQAKLIQTMAPEIATANADAGVNGRGAEETVEEAGDGIGDTRPPKGPGDRGGKEGTSAASLQVMAVIGLAAVIILGIAVGVFRFLIGREMAGPTRARWIVGAVAACLLIGACAAMFVRKKSVSFAWITDIVALVMVAIGAGLAPVLFLSPSSQVHVLKLGLLAIFCLSPGLLYFQFLRARGPALWEDFVVTLNRLGIDDFGPPQLQDEQVSNVYRRKFEATYGRFPKGQPRGKALFPVLCVTVLASIGWAATLQPPGFTDWQLFNSSDLGLPLKPEDLVALRFAFVGTSFYMAQMLVRRYFQNDLKADAYVTCLLRLFSSTFLVAAICASISGLPPSAKVGLAFAIGVFPQIGVDFLRTKVLQPIGAKMKGLEPYGLKLLDGMTVWYESRLLEEGIEDLQNLKTANWIDLVLQTRIPPGRIVDWVDQATLIVHVMPPPKGEEDPSPKLDLLREYGIATATDLEAAVYGRIEGVPGLPETDLTGLLNLRFDDASKTWVPDGRPNALPAVLRALAMEPNLRNIRNWKHQKQPLSTVDLKDQPPERTANGQAATAPATV